MLGILLFISQRKPCISGIAIVFSIDYMKSTANPDTLEVFFEGDDGIILRHSILESSTDTYLTGKLDFAASEL